MLQHPEPDPPSDDFGFDIDEKVDESLLRQLEAVEQAGTQKKSPYFASGATTSAKPKTIQRLSHAPTRYDDYDDDANEYDFDDDMDFEQIDEDEVVAAAAARSSGARGRGGKGPTQSSEVIVISD
jgi:hypothetical protein